MTTTNAQRWLYGLANLGLVVTVQAFSAYALFFYTDVRGLPPTWAATVMTIYAFYNAFNNPVLGYISDRTRTRWGRRIPYILFGAIPLVVVFILVWLAPFDGRTQPVALLIYFAAIIFVWELLYTAVSTGYYSLLPEMFPSYAERTDAAARMNLVQTIGLIVGIALPPILYDAFGWPAMAICFGVIAAAALLIGARGMFEPKDVSGNETLNLWAATKATLVNRSFVTLVLAQTMRFVATSTLTAGMAFYTKYSLGLDQVQTSIVFLVVFVAAMPALFLWRWIAPRAGARSTLMLAYAVFGVSVLPLGLVRSLVGAAITCAFVGVGLAGMLIMGDVILSDVVDEDEVKTGQRRAGMYFGMSGLIITLSSAISAVIFGWVAPAYGYDPSLAAQPASVATGFRVYMTIPSLAGCFLAVVALYFYPLYGERLRQMKARLQAKTDGSPATTGEI